MQREPLAQSALVEQNVAVWQPTTDRTVAAAAVATRSLRQVPEGGV
jgi:hypothetical protein